MPVAIHTRYLPATDKRGSRVKASVYRGRDVVWSVTVPYSEDNSVREHEQAAEALRARHWPDLPMVYAGATIDGRGEVYVVGL